MSAVGFFSCILLLSLSEMLLRVEVVASAFAEIVSFCFSDRMMCVPASLLFAGRTYLWGDAFDQGEELLDSRWRYYALIFSCIVFWTIGGGGCLSWLGIV